MSDLQVPQDKLNKLVTSGVAKLGLKDPAQAQLAQDLGQKGAAALGKLANNALGKLSGNKKFGKFRKLVGFKAGGVIVMKDVGASAPKPKAKKAKKAGRPKGSKNKK